MKKILSALLAAVLLMTACACAENLPELPAMEKVAFEKGAYEPLPLTGAAPYQINEGAFDADALRYHDETLDIQVHKLRAFDTPLFIAYVQIADVSQFRTEQARKYPSEATARVPVIAKKVNAPFAVNADWFIFHNAGVVYRKGDLLRNRVNSEYDGLFVDMNGDFHILAPLTDEGVAALPAEILHSFCFGPALVVDGQIWDNSDREITYKQRMAIGQLDELTYVLVCSDGPEEKNSIGLSIPQMAEIMHALGVRHAYNLDGGQSTYMYFNGAKVNGQKAGKGRAVGDIIYFASAVPAE